MKLQLCKVLVCAAMALSVSPMFNCAQTDDSSESALEKQLDQIGPTFEQHGTSENDADRYVQFEPSIKLQTGIEIGTLNVPGFYISGSYQDEGHWLGLGGPLGSIGNFIKVSANLVVAKNSESQSMQVMGGQIKLEALNLEERLSRPLSLIVSVVDAEYDKNQNANYSLAKLGFVEMGLKLSLSDPKDVISFLSKIAAHWGTAGKLFFNRQGANGNSVAVESVPGLGDLFGQVGVSIKISDTVHLEVIPLEITNMFLTGNTISINERLTQIYQRINLDIESKALDHFNCYSVFAEYLTQSLVDGANSSVIHDFRLGVGMQF